MTTSLMSRVKGHCTGQRTSGQNTLTLFAECVRHWSGESNDWSPLAYLIGRSEPAQARMVRSLTAKATNGFGLRKDPDQPSGYRFVKTANQNQGFDDGFLSKIDALIEAKKSVQSAEVKALVKKEAPEVTLDTFVATKAANLVKALHKKDVPYSAIIAAVQEASRKAQQASPV